uniref:Secreted protein n=1 Tax=Arundo donax TaxID=35708 RepID=A0A0A9CSV2_ARUDO
MTGTSLITGAISAAFLAASLSCTSISFVSLYCSCTSCNAACNFAFSCDLASSRSALMRFSNCSRHVSSSTCFSSLFLAACKAPVSRAAILSFRSSFLATFPLQAHCVVIAAFFVLE